jgi:hypothetical protein
MFEAPVRYPRARSLVSNFISPARNRRIFAATSGLAIFRIAIAARSLEDFLSNGVVHASTVSHPKADGPTRQRAAEDNKADPSGFDRPHH